MSSSVSVSSSSLGSLPPGVEEGQAVEAMMRRISVSDMLELAKKEDPPGRYLLHEELSRAKPDKRVVSELLKHFPSRASQVNESGSLPLHVAAANVHSIETSVLQMVLDAHPSGSKHANKLGLLPIHKAMTAPVLRSTPPQTWHLELLIDAYPPGLMARTQEKATPLHVLISSQRRICSEIIEYVLLREPLAASRADIYGQYPLHKICAKANAANTEQIVDCLTTLIDAYPKAASEPDKQGRTALHWLVCVRDKPDLEILSEVLETAPECCEMIDCDGFKPLDRLMNRGPDRCGASCLLLATKEEELYKARVLAKHVHQGNVTLRAAGKVIGSKMLGARHRLEKEAEEREAKLAAAMGQGRPGCTGKDAPGSGRAGRGRGAAAGAAAAAAVAAGGGGDGRVVVGGGGRE